MARKILLADDSVTAQNMGRKILADAGYEVITVNNGSAALKKVSEQKPDLIVLDVYMPGYSGLEVCQRLKETGDTSRIPILLTVGKLEPFKPEEARRVRADAYIVKPFEASELLSALSKLEDKVVPRSEPSKPGRFARATAAIDERFDRSMVVEEDSGWKSRIVFPKKREKEKEPEQGSDEAAIYNPVNKDLRTVVEQKPEEHPASVQPVPADERVNVSALAPEGLPKDVTPEEIAALAAAAAQFKGKIAEESPAEEKSAEEATEVPAVKTQEEPVAAAAEFPVVKGETIESKEEIPAPEVSFQPAASAIADTVVQPGTADAAKQAAVAPNAPETAAIDDLEQRSSEKSKKSEDGIAGEAPRAEEPATMAIAAAAGVGSPRWAAVAVALTPEEASLSLEQEMQKAASFALATESASAETTQTIAEPDAATMAVVEPPTPVAETTAPAVEASAMPAIEEKAPESQVGPALSDEPSTVSEPVRAEVQDFTVAKPSVSEQPEEKIPPSFEAAESVASLGKQSEVPGNAEEPTPANVLQAVDSVEAKATEPGPDAGNPVVMQELSDEKVSEEGKSEEESKKDPIETEPKVVSADVREPITASADSEAISKEAVAEVARTSSASPIAGGTDEMAKKESEITATTAAAWASWRKIRETGKTAKESEDVSELKDEAAKAVAAGAESSPEEVAALDSDPEIANIVDTVLADMRPKIVEEIAKKLGKKK